MSLTARRLVRPKSYGINDWEKGSMFVCKCNIIILWLKNMSRRILFQQERKKDKIVLQTLWPRQGNKCARSRAECLNRIMLLKTFKMAAVYTTPHLILVKQCHLWPKLRKYVPTHFLLRQCSPCNNFCTPTPLLLLLFLSSILPQSWNLHMHFWLTLNFRQNHIRIR